MNKGDLIYVAGHKGLVGSAIVRELLFQGYDNLLLREHGELDLTNQVIVDEFFRMSKPKYVFLAAAKVGGIMANNDSPGDFYYINSMIQNNVIHSSYKYGVEKLLFLGSSCIYPKMCPQPIKEEYLLTGPLEETNEAYAIAKISGLKMCQYYRRQYGASFISAMPTNLYGPNDNFDLETSHVLPALIRKFHEAKASNNKEVEIWGTGTPRREFLYVDDLANALIFLMNNYNEESHINVGTGEDISISDLALLIKEIIGYKGTIVYDESKPDGTPRKLLDVSRINNLGWRHKQSLKNGIFKTYKLFERTWGSDK